MHFKSILWLGIVLWANYGNGGADPTCFFPKWPPNQPNAPITLPGIAENITGGYPIFMSAIENYIAGAGIYASAHSEYMGYSYHRTDFQFITRDKTRDFVKDFNTRSMIQHIYLECLDMSKVNYTFMIPIL